VRETIEKLVEIRSGLRLPVAGYRPDEIGCRNGNRKFNGKRC
jgi:hypothetical protein